MSDRDDTDLDDVPTEGDPGFLGGGGPAETIEPADPEDEDAHLADTDHGER